MRKFAWLLMTVIFVAGCAIGPQPYWQAPNRADLNQSKDDLECRALANQAATGAGNWSSDRHLRDAFYQQAVTQYYVQCVESRGYTLVTPR